MLNKTLAVLALAGLPFASATDAQSSKFVPATLNGVPNTYMVALERTKPGEPGLLSGQSVEATATALAADYSATVSAIWEHVALGFVATMTAQDAERMASDSFVSLVVQDTYFSGEEALAAAANHCYFHWDGNPNTFPYNVNNRSLPNPPQSVVCTDPDPQHDTLPGEPICIDNWGLDRLDQSDLPRNAIFGYSAAGGSGVRVYMLDTGIWPGNREFTNSAGASRIAPGFDAVVPSNGTSDCYGHGTHTAGILGGRTYGVAKNVTLVPVRFVGCGPSGGANQTSWVVAALNWIAGQHGSGANGTEIVSWSGGNNFNWVTGALGSELVQLAVHELIQLPRLVLVQSAGNQNTQTACSLSFGDELAYSDPNLRAAIAQVIVVGGSDEVDNRWTDRPGDPFVGCQPPPATCAGSNGGRCLDVFAPAAHILSAAALLDTNAPPPSNAFCQLSGTSMAAPHVAGAAALYLENRRFATAAEVKAYLLGISALDRLNTTSIGANSPNRLLKWEINNPPVSVIQPITCQGRTCHFDGTASLDDHQVTAHLWQLEGHRFVIEAAVFDFTFSESGPHLVMLETRDAGARFGQTTVTLQVP